MVVRVKQQGCIGAAYVRRLLRNTKHLEAAKLATQNLEFDTSQALGGHMRRHREELSRLKAQEQLEIKVVHEPQTKAHDQADSENGSQVVLHSNLIEISQNTNPEGLSKTLVLFGTEERSKPFFLFGTILF
ncbi:hypothetical protein AMTR_s00070p00194870 [Amborella trichopoda]|uniref:Uncharacterized protein n=1 Tax=Amborella trichopoda TaxID=13333 RepID=U5D501_AMBTC|nr:hypothetical protein AMTR_s00070p00194870 [Amborella trichopoda]